MRKNGIIAAKAGVSNHSAVGGMLVQVRRNDLWLLLDDVNLASAETLECLSGVLEQ